MSLQLIDTMLTYSDWANGQVLSAAAGLNDAKLDQPFDMGPGSLRRTLLHIYNGEHVWLQRWQGRTESPWPSEDERVSVTDLTGRFRRTWAARSDFLRTVVEAGLAETVVYRDSKGSLFTATLRDMIVQMCTHSTHHRAQAVNMLRRLGGPALELDYMMHVRRPA